MTLQEHLPKDKPASEEQEWGFTIWEFINANKYYLGIALVVLLIYLISRNYYNKYK